MQTSKKWQPEEIQWLIDNYSSFGSKKSAQELNKTVDAVRLKASRLSIKFHEEPKNANCKICAGCNTEKPFELFSKSKGNKNGVSWICKECQKDSRKENEKAISARGRDYYKRNKQKIIESHRIYYAEEKEKIAIRSKIFREENKAKIKLYAQNNKERTNRNLREKRRTNINFRLREYLSRGITKALRSKKTESVLELTGCSIKYLKAHLESQFLPEMTWDNHGDFGWHTDHIIPCAMFNLSEIEQRKICFNFSNLMPRWGTTAIAKTHNSNQIGNIEKGKKLVDSSYYKFLENGS